MWIILLIVLSDAIIVLIRAQQMTRDNGKVDSPMSSPNLDSQHQVCHYYNSKVHFQPKATMRIAFLRQGVFQSELSVGIHVVIVYQLYSVFRTSTLK